MQITQFIYVRYRCHLATGQRQNWILVEKRLLHIKPIINKITPQAISLRDVLVKQMELDFVNNFCSVFLLFKVLHKCAISYDQKGYGLFFLFT